MSKQVQQIKERLKHLANEVYAEDLFPPVDYKELKATLGSKLLSRVSADNFRYSAKSILDWIESEIETEDKPITPEFLEGLGFDLHLDNVMGEKIWKLKDITVSFDVYDKEVNVCRDIVADIGVVLDELPHIRTQAQLTNLITALFGEVSND